MDIEIYKEIIVAVLIGLSAIVGAIARPYFAAFKKPSDCCFSNDHKIKLEQIHAWHSPDHHGEQGWRGHQIEKRLDGLQADIDKLVDLARRS